MSDLPVSEAPAPSGPRRSRMPQRVAITTRTMLIAALVVFFGWAVVTVRDALLIVFLGVFLGLVFEAPARFVMRHTRFGRGLSGMIVVLGSAIVLTILALLLLRPMLESMRDFLQQLPEIVEDLKDSDELGWLGDTSAGDDASSAAETVSSRIPDALSALVGVAGEFFTLGLTIFTLIFTAMFFISDAPRLQRALGSLLPPAEAFRTEDLWERVTNTVSRWAIGALIIACIAGTVQGGTAWLLGSSYALALGIIAGFLDLIPNIGATIAGFILTLVILAEEGVTAAIIMLVVVLVYQQVENNILTPTIQGKAVNISGFFVITGVTVFGALLGVVGALIAVPVIGSLQVIIGEYTKERRERLAALRAQSEAEAPAAPG